MNILIALGVAFYIFCKIVESADDFNRGVKEYRETYKWFDKFINFFAFGVPEDIAFGTYKGIICFVLVGGFFYYIMEFILSINLK